ELIEPQLAILAFRTQLEERAIIPQKAFRQEADASILEANAGLALHQCAAHLFEAYLLFAERDLDQEVEPVDARAALAAAYPYLRFVRAVAEVLQIFQAGDGNAMLCHLREHPLIPAFP